VEDVTAADGITVHKGYDGDRQRPDLALEVQDVQAGDPVAADVASVAADVLVPTGAERVFTGSGEQDAAYRRVVPDPVEGVDELIDRLGPESVADLRPVDGEASDAVRIARRGCRCKSTTRVQVMPAISGDLLACSAWNRRLGAVMNGKTIARNWAGASILGAWPAPGITARRAPGIAAATASARARTGSCSPTTTSVGTDTPPRRP